jgi:hypothetical protein
MFVICSITDMPRQLQHFVAPDAEGYAFAGYHFFPFFPRELKSDAGIPFEKRDKSDRFD